MACSLGTASFFGGFSLIFYFGDWARFLFAFSVGLFAGLVGAPELEEKAFKNAALFQIISGTIAGSITGLYFGLSINNVITGAIAGGFLGWLAPYWIKHVQIP